MKFNKKLIVPFLATVTGLSITGGLGGAFAWYQFNSQVRTSFIGQSVAKGHVLQIGYMDNSVIKWSSMRNLGDVGAFVPVTFGALTDTAGNLATTAYGYPRAGAQLGNDYTQGWKNMTSPTKTGYVQYDIYLRALENDPTSTGSSSDPTNIVPAGQKLVAKNVYMSSMTLADAEHPNDDTYTANALRVHLNVAGTDGKKFLISKTAITNANPLHLYGNLDLDGDGDPDKPFSASTTSSTAPITYGISGDEQITSGISDIVETNMASPTASKLICTTNDGTGSVTKITVTVWLEGWALLRTTEGASANEKAVWRPELTGNNHVNVDMVFDVGDTIA